MVSSPMYDRLMKFVEGVEESHKLSGYDCEHSTIIAGMGMMSASVSHFKEYQGFEGQTGDAIDSWIDQTQQRYSSERQGYVTGTEHYVEGRRLLMHAAEDAKLLSPTLLDKATESMRDLAQVVIPVAKHLGPFGEPITTIATTGAAYVDAIEAQANAQREAAFRNQHIGFVFQFHRLLPEFTALENVMIPALIARDSAAEAERKARELLDFLHLSDRITHKPAELSGGEKQRVAVARALINRPSVVLADEPSGSLDSHSKDELHRLFFNFN